MDNTLQENKKSPRIFNESTAFSTREAYEFMQPVEDTDKGTLTFTCCLCQKQYVAEKDEDIHFYFNEKVVPGVNNTGGGLLCPNCEKENI